MLKWIGAALICASTTLLGMQMVFRLKQRESLLTMLQKGLHLIRGEIQFAGIGLSELFLSMEQTLGDPFGGWLRGIGERLWQQDGESFQMIWHEGICVPLASMLPKEDCVWLEGLGELLGVQDKAMQLGILDLDMEQLESRITEAQARVREKSRMYHCVGVMSGMLLVILLF